MIFTEDNQERMKHQMKDVTQAQKAMIL